MAPDRWRMPRPCIFRPQEFIVPLEEVAGAVGPFLMPNKQRLVGGNKEPEMGRRCASMAMDILKYDHDIFWSLMSTETWNRVGTEASTVLFHNKQTEMTEMTH